jgi:hypothetical protein
MKSMNIKITFLFLIVVAVISLSSCDKKARITEEEYVIKVDSIETVDTVQLNQMFQVDFFGIVGENGCYRFSRFYTERTGMKFRIQAIGLREVGDNLICPELLPMLNGQNLQLKADSLGTIKLEIINPGINQLIRKDILVLP